MSSRTLWNVAVFLAAVSAAAATTCAADEPSAPQVVESIAPGLILIRPDIDPAEAAIRQALSEKTRVGGTDKPLREYLDWFTKRHHVQIAIDEPTLKDEGVDPNMRVSFQV